MKTSPCPNPDKSRYATMEAAEKAARRANTKIGRPLTPYACACTWIHLTKGIPQKPINPDDATGTDAELVRVLPHAAFREIVANDARNQGQHVQRAAIRHDNNLKRWWRILNELIDDANTQLKAREHDQSLKAHDWRKRTTGYRDNLVLRSHECERLRAEAHARAHTRNDTKRRDLEQAVARGVTVSELRRLAGEVAIDRLIDAHADEFNTYLAEAHADAGISLPERIARRLPKEAA